MRARSITILGLAFIVAAPHTASAQVVEPRRVFGRYQQFVWNDQHGLPQNSAGALTRTRDGYLWIGTADGLARFDGVRFTIFSRSNTPALRDHTVKALHQDRGGALWVATQSGLARVHEGQFSWQSPMDDDQIGSIAEDADGALWFGTYRHGLFRFAQGRWTAFSTADGLPHNQVNTVTVDSVGRLWVGTAAGLVVREAGGFVTFTEKDGLPADEVHALARGGDGSLWVGTERGVATVRERRFSTPPGLAAYDGPVSALLYDRDGALWVGTAGAGVYRYLDHQLASYRAGDGLPDDRVISLYQDPDGDVWIGTNGWGLAQLREPVVQVLTVVGDAPRNPVFAIHEDRDGTFWVGSGHGVSRIRDGAITTYSSRDGVDGGVSVLARDPDGQLWIGTRRGIMRWRNGRFTPVPELHGRRAVAMLADRGGSFWLATLNHGLYRLRHGRIQAHLTMADGLPANELLALYEDSSGALWLGTFNRGMSRLKDGRITTWTTRDGLATNHIVSFCEDSAGTFWVGTHGGGLHRLEANGTFRVISTAQGLYDDVAFQVLDDGGGNLWMVGNRGIYRTALTSLNTVADGTATRLASSAYGVADGMLSREGNGGSPAAIQSRDGRLWFASMGGMVAIDPKVRNHQPPQVAIERLRIDGVEAAGDDPVIMPGQQNVEIDYTGFAWSRPQQIRFRYRLLGLDRDWVEAGSRRTAYYSRLPPGDYRFQVIADNGDGIWNLEGRTLALSVAPYFYQRLPFQASLALAAGLALAGGWRYRVSSIRARQFVQQTFARQLIASQEAERKRIAAELHDGLGQHLIVVKNFALLALNGGTDDDQRARIQGIADSASQAIREVREIAQNLRPYQLDRLGLTLAIAGMSKQAEAASAVTFTTTLDDIDRVLSPDAEINLYRVVQECVHNIIKHADATSASVTVRREPHRLVVMVADDGRGFEIGLARQAPSSGYGLLSIVERVRLLAGEVHIDTAPGRGTTITIEVDLAKVAR